MRFSVLACDYDGTIAIDGVIGAAAVAALRRVRESGRRLVLVTGRTRAQLDPLAPGISLFSLLVLENGALVVDPETGEESLVGPPLPARLVSAVRGAGVGPLVCGRSICATRVEWRDTLRRVAGGLGLAYDTVLNRQTVMLLPAGVDKGSGLREALRRLGEDTASCVAAGDAENDVPLLEAAGCGIAVGDATVELRAVARVVLPLGGTQGVEMLAGRLIADDLASLLQAPAGRRDSSAER